MNGADWSSIVNAGAGIFNTIIGSKDQNKAIDAQNKAIAASERIALLQKEQSERTLKVVLIGVGMLVAGGVAIAVIKS